MYELHPSGVASALINLCFIRRINEN